MQTISLPPETKKKLNQGHAIFIADEEGVYIVVNVKHYNNIKIINEINNYPHKADKCE